MAKSTIKVNRSKIEELCAWGMYYQVNTEISLYKPISNYDMLIFYTGWDDITAGKHIVCIPTSLCSTNINLLTRIGEIVVNVASQKVTITRIVRNNPTNNADGALRHILGMRF